MKGIALSTVAYMILAIVAISLLIMLVGIRISPALRKAYCSSIRGISSILPLPQHLKPSQPVYCETNAVKLEKIKLNTNIPEEISFKIASYVAACWEKTGVANIGRDQICYEIDITGVNGEVSESSVKTLLERQNYQNMLTWKTGSISSPKSIAIMYDGDSKKIEVV